MNAPVRRGFTLIELLVVVAIIALLIAILLPSLGRAREITKRTVCATHLKSLSQATSIYAAQWKDSVPVTSGTGLNWLWDESNEFCDMLMATNPTVSADAMAKLSVRRMFYCPSNMAQNANELWDFGAFRVIGYGVMNERIGRFTAVVPGVVGYVRSPPLKFMRKFNAVPNASTTEYAFDANISSDNPPTNWTSISGGWAERHSTPHLKGKAPAGQNIAYADAHVDWRNYSQSRNTGFPAGPYFWIQSP